jgi:hypothetical protein
MPQSSVIFFTNKYYPNGKRGDNFRQDFTFQHERGVAFHNENTLFASSINEGGSVHFVSFPNASLADLKDWVPSSHIRTFHHLRLSAAGTRPRQQNP